MLTTRYVVSMTRTRLAAALAVVPFVALALSGCASGQSVEDACGVVGEQWTKVTEMTEAMESPNDASWVKSTWNQVADELRTVNTGDEFFDDAAAAAAEHASTMPRLVDDTVAGVEGVSEKWADTVTAFGTEITKIQINCSDGF